MSACSAERPRRGSFRHRIYIDLIIGQRLRRGGVIKQKRRQLFGDIAAKRGVHRRVVRKIYDRFIRPQMRAGVDIVDLTS